MDVICDGCGRRNPASRRFCQQCGRYLSPDLVRVPPESTPTPPRPPGTGPPVDAPAMAGGTTPASTSADPGVPMPAPVVGDAESACPACGTGNPPTLQFCRHCGQVLRARGATGSAPPLAAPAKKSWWQRFKERWTWGASAASRSRYRGSLPSRYRLIRYGIPVTVVGLIIAFVLWTGDPVAWIRARYYDVRGTIEPLDVTAVRNIGKPDGTAENITDPEPTTYWSTPWSAAIAEGSGPASDSCTEPVPGATGLMVSFAQTDALKGLRLELGTVAGTVAQWEATKVRIRFTDQSCVWVDVKKTRDSQDVRFDATSTNSATITVIDAEPQNTTAAPFVAIRSVVPLARPE